MRILAIDTSTGPASAALIEGNTVLATHEDAESMRQSQRLVGDVDALLRANGGYAPLDALAVTTGPGGFTGIRVALAAARGLSLACDIPLIGISSLETFAWQALQNSATGTSCVAFVNAFRNQAYTQAFRRSSTGMEPLSEAQAMDIDSTATFAAGYPQSLLLGNIPAETLGITGYTHHAAPHARFTAGYALMLLAEDSAAAIANRPAEAHYIRPPDAKPQKPLFSA